VKSTGILKPTATLTASSSNLSPHEAIGDAKSQSPLYCEEAARKNYYYYYYYLPDALLHTIAKNNNQLQHIGYAVASGFIALNRVAWV